MKEFILAVGVIFTFGAVYQIVTHPTQSSAVMVAGAGDAQALSQALTGR